MAIEGGCNAVASTFGILGSVARKYAHKIPFVVKLNHNELLSYPNSFDQVLFGTVKEAWNMGAVAVGATIYFGSEQSRRQYARYPDRQEEWTHIRYLPIGHAPRETEGYSIPLYYDLNPTRERKNRIKLYIKKMKL